MDRNMKLITEKVGREELLCQLAEEASELAVAANKLRRSLTDKNPTPIATEDAYQNLLQEVADVSNCLVALGLDNGMNRMFIWRTAKDKMVRWVARLERGGKTQSEPAE